MVYLKQLFNGRTTPLFMTFLVLVIIIIQVEGTKIAYKKPIHGKANAIKEKRLKPKVNEETNATTTITTTTTTSRPTAIMPLVPPPIKNETVIQTTTPTTTTHDELEVAETTHSIKTELKLDDKPKEAGAVNEQKEQTVEKFSGAITTANSVAEFQEAALAIEDLAENQQQTETTNEKLKNISLDWPASQELTVVEEPPNSNELLVDSAVEATVLTENSTTENSTSTLSTTSNSADSVTANIRPVPCTCGVFMTSQIKRSGNPYEQPIGKPVIINELDRTFPCTAVGQKQCQTKCLETIVQHLPNSANILCATLDHDIRKERAYLFIKNCRNQWFNTNLAAGREYCCKNGQPYQCPLV